MEIGVSLRSLRVVLAVEGVNEEILYGRLQESHAEENVYLHREGPDGKACGIQQSSSSRTR